MTDPVDLAAPNGARMSIEADGTMRVTGAAGGLEVGPNGIKLFAADGSSLAIVCDRAEAPFDAPLPRLKVPPPPEGACGCPCSSWWYDDVRCHEPAGHPGHHEGPGYWPAKVPWRSADCRPLALDTTRPRTFSWAPRASHPRPCGCRLCSDAAPNQAVIDRALAKAGPESSVEELIEGGFVVSRQNPKVPGRPSTCRVIAKAGTVEGLAEKLGA